MSDPLLEEEYASTPLTAEEREGLIRSYVTLRRELNEVEQANIPEAERNVGVDPVLIATNLRQFLDDSCYWIEHATYAPDEICARFH